MISFIEKANESPALNLGEAGKGTFLVTLCLKAIVSRMSGSSKIPLHHVFLSMMQSKKRKKKKKFFYVTKGKLFDVKQMKRDIFKTLTYFF